MSIKVDREPQEFAAFGMERCCFCHSSTAYWFTPKDVPVCPACAKTHDESDVPSKADWWHREQEKLGLKL